MKKVAITLTILLAASMQVRLPETGVQASLRQSADSGNSIPTLQRRGEGLPEKSIELPDAQIPKDVAHERGPCPAGNDQLCALLGGLRFYKRTTLTEHDKTWGNAMRHSVMWVRS